MADDPELANIISGDDLDDERILSDSIDEHPPLEGVDHLGRTKEEEGIPVEDLPLERRIELAKNCSNPYGELKTGIWVDAMDTINAWLVSTIEEIEDGNVRVHYDGWPSKWDDWMRIGSYKIAPFRKNSIGYTGQTKIAMRKTEYTLDEYKDFMTKIDTCIENNLKGLGAIETTQFFRGTIFSALDNIMGRSYEPEDDELLELSVPFVKKCIELVCTYLKLVPTFLEKFDEARLCSDLYLIDENVSIALCYKEFIEMLKTVF